MAFGVLAGVEAHALAFGFTVLSKDTLAKVTDALSRLICPAEFDLCEDAKVVLMSVTEGEEKPLKYPLFFHLARVMVLTKIDLLPYLPFNLEKCLANARQVNPALTVLQTCALQADGLDDWIAWITGLMHQKAPR